MKTIFNDKLKLVIGLALVVLFILVQSGSLDQFSDTWVDKNLLEQNSKYLEEYERQALLRICYQKSYWLPS